ncbi:MAG TPA: TRAP transporter small permease [Candidatus Methylomirabilis sp.]|nr:TRAP transporter small permease [Candidatus Methylomirabilis sp.]
MSGLIHSFRVGADRALSAAIGVALLAIFFLNMYQVGGRYVFSVGAVWIPDVTRFLFIWMVFLGTALMHLRRGHLVIDYIQVRLPDQLRQATEALISGSMLALAGILVVVGWRIVQIRMDIPYTGWEIPTGYAYLSVPVAASLIGLTSLADLWAWLQERRLKTGSAEAS